MDTQAVFFIIIIVLMVVSGCTKAIFLQRTSMWFMWILFAIICYGFATGFVISLNAVSHVALRPIRALLTLIGCYSVLILIARIKKQNLITLPIDKYIFFSIAAHSLIMIAEFISPPFRDAIYTYTVSLERVVGARLYYSMAGLSNGGGAQISVYQSIGVLLLPLLLAKTTTLKSKVFISLCGVASFISVLISGRSGVVGIFIFYPVVLFLIDKDELFLKKALSNAIFGGFVLAFALFVLIWDSNAFFKYESSEGFEAVKIRSIELARGEDTTVELLLDDHILFPDDIETFFWGNPRLFESDQNDSYRILNSDIGYVRVLFGYGLFGSFLHYLFYGGVIKLSFSVYKKQSPFRNFAAFSIVVAIVILFFNCKEVFVFTRVGFSIVGLSIFALACQNKHLKRYHYSLTEVSRESVLPPSASVRPRVN